MKRSRKRGRWRLFYLSVMLIVASSLIFGFRDILKGRNSQTISEDELPTALNFLVTNELNNLQETEKLDAQVVKFMKEWQIRGASLAIMKNEKLIYTKGYGWADEEMGEKMEPRHILRIASLSKLITAAGIMKMVDDTLLSLDTKVFGEKGILNMPQFLNIKDARIKNITIEHLLRHKAGFTLRAGDPMFSTRLMAQRLKIDSVPDTDQIISYYTSSKLGYAPGNGSRYSNLGYVILSRVIEVVSGMKYEEYIKEKILKPAGIYDMHLAHNFYEEKFPNEVRYYEPSNEPKVEAFDGSGQMVQRCYGGNNIEGLLGAGAWVASPSELLLLVASIDGREGIPDILSQKSISVMTSSTPQNLPIGWAKTTSSGDWSRTGTLSGSSAMLKYQRDEISWVLITNTSSWKGSRFPRQIDGLLRKSLQRVSDWPERNLFELKL